MNNQQPWRGRRERREQAAGTGGGNGWEQAAGAAGTGGGNGREQAAGAAGTSGGSAKVQRVRPCGHVHARFAQPARFAGPAEPADESLLDVLRCCRPRSPPGTLSLEMQLLVQGDFSSNTK